MQSQISEEIHRIRGPRDPRDQVYDGVIAIDSDPGCLPSVAVVLVGAITGRKILLFFALFPPHQHKTTAQGSRMHTSSILRLRLLHSSASPIFGPHQVPHVSLSVVKHSQQHQQRLQASQYAPASRNDRRTTSKNNESFEQWFAGFDIPDNGMRAFHGQPRSHMSGSTGNRCLRCAEQGIETFVMKGKHCPKCGQPC